jgi:hypothetical protein
MALNCYPQQHDRVQGVVGLPARTDNTFVTVLLANSAGLEEFDREAGSWRAVPHGPGYLAVHVGNYLGVVSNGRYRAALHRVVASSGQGGGCPSPACRAWPWTRGSRWRETWWTNAVQRCTAGAVCGISSSFYLPVAKAASSWRV